MIKRLLFLFFISSSLSLSATHLVGSTMSYRSLGGDSIEITLKVYRDCYNGAVPFDMPAIVSIFNDTNRIMDLTLTAPLSIDTLHFVAQDTCIDTNNITDSLFCYEIGTYKTIAHIPPIPGGYLLVYDRCCLPANFSNVHQSLETGVALSLFIADTGIVNHNHSAELKPASIDVVCLNKYNDINHYSTDVDGDSLVYQLFTPYNSSRTWDSHLAPKNPPYSDIIYSPPYTSANPFGGLPVLMDSNTGMLQIGPSSVGLFLYGVRVSEYRSGKYLGYSEKVDFVTSVPNVYDTTTPPPPPWIGIKENDSFGFQVAPNPGNGQFELSFPNASEPIEIEVYNSLGRSLVLDVIKGESYFLDLTDEPAGVFFIRCSSGNTVRTKRLISID
jgi:hypothetical protein